MEHLFHLPLIVVGIVLLLLGVRKIPDLLRPLGGGPPSGPHPLPVTSPVETSRPSSPEEKQDWHSLLRLLRWRFKR
jgi:hypothetical protein